MSEPSRFIWTKMGSYWHAMPVRASADATPYYGHLQAAAQAAGSAADLRNAQQASTANMALYNMMAAQNCSLPSAMDAV